MRFLRLKQILCAQTGRCACAVRPEWCEASSTGPGFPSPRVLGEGQLCEADENYFLNSSQNQLQPLLTSRYCGDSADSLDLPTGEDSQGHEDEKLLRSLPLCGSSPTASSPRVLAVRRTSETGRGDGSTLTGSPGSPDHCSTSSPLSSFFSCKLAAAVRGRRLQAWHGSPCRERAESLASSQVGAAGPVSGAARGREGNGTKGGPLCKGDEPLWAGVTVQRGFRCSWGTLSRWPQGLSVAQSSPLPWDTCGESRGGRARAVSTRILASSLLGLQKD